ncbi:hypothetical protein J3E69DRAFT_325434 [Trichoderma sp. SZMC 28015]
MSTPICRFDQHQSLCCNLTTSQPCRQTTDSRSPARINRNTEALFLLILSLQQQLDK